MAIPSHRRQFLLRAMHYWNRRIQQEIQTGRPLTDPQVITWSHALDRCVAAWYHLERDPGTEGESFGAPSDLDTEASLEGTGNIG
jgi:hypothetical protein